MGEEIQEYISIMNYYEPAINKFLSENGLSYPAFSDTITAVKFYILRRVLVTRKSGMELGNQELYKWLHESYSLVDNTK